MSAAAGPGVDPGSAEQFARTLATLEGRRVALVVTGSLSAAYLPYWLNFVSGLEAPPRLQVLLTRSATRMVAPTAVRALAGGEVAVDTWEDAPEGASPHVELAEWAEAFVVHPCTFSYLGRLAAGLADSPAQLAMQCSPAPKVVCPALPPGTLRSPAYQAHLRTLAEQRPDVTVLEPTQGVSAATGRREGLPPAYFPVALATAAAALGETGAPSAGSAEDAA
ncbi:flavoprotein [Nocardioides nanhaiensis]|uniref:Flavoprotein domain-containing protein n=1 Tax=Nocardioides nanhaiensis TaxID=1476871 RepID=A0ABP8VTR5_9ACTN